MRIRRVEFPRASRREDIQIAYDLICDSGFRFVRRGKFPRAKFHGYLAGQFREKHVAGQAGKATVGEDRTRRTENRTKNYCQLRERG